MSGQVASTCEGLAASAAAKVLGHAFGFGLDASKFVVIHGCFLLHVLLSGVEIGGVDLGLTVGLLLHRVVRQVAVVVKLGLVVVTQLGLRLAQAIGLPVELHCLMKLLSQLCICHRGMSSVEKPANFHASCFGQNWEGIVPDNITQDGAMAAKGLRLLESCMIAS